MNLETITHVLDESILKDIRAVRNEIPALQVWEGMRLLELIAVRNGMTPMTYTRLNGDSNAHIRALTVTLSDHIARHIDECTAFDCPTHLRPAMDELILMVAECDTDIGMNVLSALSRLLDPDADRDDFLQAWLTLPNLQNFDDSAEVEGQPEKTYIYGLMLDNESKTARRRSSQRRQMLSADIGDLQQWRLLVAYVKNGGKLSSTAYSNAVSEPSGTRRNVNRALNRHLASLGLKSYKRELIEI